MEAHSHPNCSHPYWQERIEQGEARDPQAGLARLVEFKEIVQSLSPWQRRLLLVSLYYLMALGNLRRFLRI